MHPQKHPKVKDPAYQRFIDKTQALVEENSDNYLAICRDHYQTSGKGSLVLWMHEKHRFLRMAYWGPTEALKLLRGVKKTNYLPEAMASYNPETEGLVYCIDEEGYSVVLIVQE